MQKQQQYPEVNALNAHGCKQALILAALNHDAIDEAERTEFYGRVRAIRERLRRLTATAKRITDTQGGR